MNCPKCGSEMSRCDSGHNHGRDIFKEGAPLVTGVRGEREGHWYCGSGDHGVIELFDDGDIEEL